MIRKVFVAGPLFSESDRATDKKIVELCESLNLKTFWSWRDAERFKVYTSEAIHSVNKEALDSCDLVIANLDGSDIDSGTSWEIGYAFAKGKPVIGIRSDFRIHTKNQKVNLAVESCLKALTSNLDDLKETILKLKTY